VKLKRKLNSTKSPRKIKKNNDQIKKIYDKLKLNDEIENKKISIKVSRIKI
jgi:hypothetical protein